MKLRHTLLAALGVVVLGGVATTACTSPDRVYGPETGATGTGTGASTGAGGAGTSSSTGATMSAGTGTTTMLPCAASSDCPGKETECQTRTCNGGFCGIGFSPAGKVISSQSAGDCHQTVCDGQGVITQQIDNTDIPEDSNPCTKDVCTAGMSSHAAAAGGTTCGGTLTCDGNGNCTGCSSPGDCPGSETDCQARSCMNAVCGFAYQPAGTKVTMQTAADCKQNVCNGIGAVSVTFDAKDLQDDGNECTQDGCSNGSPTHANLLAGALCINPKTPVCNGSGACVECVQAPSCSGQDDECKTRTCNGGSCGFAFTASGTPVALQTAGDCHESVCDGSGGVTKIADDSDVQQDGNPCTSDACSKGTIVHTPLAMGTDCGAPKKCDAAGNCVGCLSAMDCAGSDTECQTRVCNANICGLNFTASGTPVAAQTPNDCQKNVCNGSGGVTVIADNSDVASDGVECTTDTCSGGAPSYPPAPPGSPCSVGGAYCNNFGGCGVCAPGDVASCNCVHKTYACCNPLPAAPASAVELLASGVDDSVPFPPGGTCCCIETKDCDGTGQWGLCY